MLRNTLSNIRTEFKRLKYEDKLWVSFYNGWLAGTYWLNDQLPFYESHPKHKYFKRSLSRIISAEDNVDKTVENILKLLNKYNLKD